MTGEQKLGDPFDQGTDEISIANKEIFPPVRNVLEFSDLERV